MYIYIIYNHRYNILYDAIYIYIIIHNYNTNISYSKGYVGINAKKYRNKAGIVP